MTATLRGDIGQLRRFLGRRSKLGLLVVYLFGIAVARQMEVYAGAPEGDATKDCSVKADGMPVPEFRAVARPQASPTEIGVGFLWEESPSRSRALGAAQDLDETCT